MQFSLEKTLRIIRFDANTSILIFFGTRFTSRHPCRHPLPSAGTPPQPAPLPAPFIPMSAPPPPPLPDRSTLAKMALLSPEFAPPVAILSQGVHWERVKGTGSCNENDRHHFLHLPAPFFSSHDLPWTDLPYQKWHSSEHQSPPSSTSLTRGLGESWRDWELL